MDQNTFKKRHCAENTIISVIDVRNLVNCRDLYPECLLEKLTHNVLGFCQKSFKNFTKKTYIKLWKCTVCSFIF